MYKSVFGKCLRDYRAAIFWFSFGFLFISFYLMYFFPYINRSTEMLSVMEDMPPFIRNLMGDMTALTTPEGFFALQPFSMMAPLLILIFAITKGNDIVAGEVERGTLDLLLSHPLPRWRVLVEKFAVVGFGLCVIGSVFWTGMTLAALSFSIQLHPGRLAGIIFSSILLGLTFAALTLFMGVLTLRRKLSSGVISGFGVVAYLVNAYAPVVVALKPYRIFSPFYYYNGVNPLVNGLNPGHLLIQFGLIAVFLLGSLVIFERRDLVN